MELSLPTDLNFVSLQVDYWDNPWQNRHAYLWELSERYPVFFQSPPFYIVDLLERQRLRTRLKGGLHQIKPNLFGYVPPKYLPYNYRFPRMDAMITRIRDAHTRWNAQRRNFINPVLLVWHPRFAPELGKHDERLVVYFKYDNYAGYFSDSTTRQGESDDNEMRLLDRADLVFVTSQGLYDMHREYEHKLHLVPNGVDYDHFADIALNSDIQEPPDLANIPKPRIGYVGVVNEKVDFQLLTSICRSHRDWSIVLIGPEKTRQPEFRKHLKEFTEQPNAYLLGQKEGREVPNYMKGLDVCLMCYLVNDWTYYGYPLKMHEYLAVGRPTVATNLPAIREFSHVIPIAKSTEEWIAAIEEGLSGRDGITSSQRQSVAKENSWSNRVDLSLHLISECLAHKFGRRL